MIAVSHHGKELTGQRFGRWLVLRLAGRTPHGAITWNCRCDCGTEREVSGNTLRMGTSQSCGCILRERWQRGYTHGLSKTAEYQCWADMRSRCENANDSSYPNYGGRGIRVCDRWLSFVAFYADMGPRPTPRHSIDRYPDNNGNYEPSNCRWATPKEQAGNRRTNRLLTFADQTLPVSQWAARLTMCETTLRGRLAKGWPVELALTAPINSRLRNLMICGNRHFGEQVCDSSKTKTAASGSWT